MTAHTKIRSDHEERIVTEECWSCGNFFIPGRRFENEFTRSEGGEKYSIFLCDDCKKKRHELEW